MIIKPYYCPHCGNFKWGFQTYVTSGIFGKRYCKHCDRFVYDTMEEFEDYLNDKKYKESEQDD